MNNPAFRNEAFTSSQGAVAVAQNISAEQLDEIYNRPSVAVQGEVMTVEDTVVKSVIAFVVLIAGAAIGWVTVPTVPFLWMGAALVAFVLALVNIFKKQPSAPLILAYAAFEGVFVGGISAFYNAVYDGIVVQALLATFAVVGVTLALFATGKVRASAKATKVFLIAMVGYLVFSVANVFVMLFGGANANPWGLRGQDLFGTGIPLGLVLGVLVVILAAYSLVLDFDMIQKGVQNKAPRVYGWSGAFGIMVTVVWLYLELLRMFAIARD